MTTADRPPDNPLRPLLEVVAMQIDILAAYLEQVYAEAFIETAGKSGAVTTFADHLIRTSDDGSMTIEFGDGVRGQRPPFEDRRLIVRYRRGAGEVTLAYLPAAPARPPAASDPSPPGGGARGRRSAARRPSPRRD